MIEAYRDNVVTEEIDGISYTSTKFPMTPSLALLGRVVRILGEAGLQAVAVSNGRNTNWARVLSGGDPRLFAAVSKLAEGLEVDPSLPKDLCTRLKASHIRPAGEEGGSVAKHFDAHFAGELVHLFKVLAFVLGHNFMGFTLGSLSLNGSHTPEPTTEDAP